MNARINLGSFIEEVKSELLKTKKSVSDSYLYLDDVELEVSFGFDSTAGATAKLFVLEAGGETTTSQTHKVKLKFTPGDKLSEEERHKRKGGR